MNQRSPTLSRLLVIISIIAHSFTAKAAPSIAVDFDFDTGNLIVAKGNAEPLVLDHNARKLWDPMAFRELEQDGNNLNFVWDADNSQIVRLTSDFKVEGNSVRFENQWKTEGGSSEDSRNVQFFISGKVNVSENPKLAIALDGEVVLDISEFQGMPLNEALSTLVRERLEKIQARAGTATQVVVSGWKGVTLTFTIESTASFDYFITNESGFDFLTFRIRYGVAADTAGNVAESGSNSWSLQVD